MWSRWSAIPARVKEVSRAGSPMSDGSNHLWFSSVSKPAAR
jgi:hypothetical protein